MSTNSNFNQEVYAKNQPLIIGAPVPIISPYNNTGVGRAPTTKDFAPLGTLWIWKPQNNVYILASVVANVATWILVTAGSGSGVFSSLTVTPGPTSITGTTGINTAGAGVTTINTGGTGALNLGNATGNTAVTGHLTASTGLTATTGGIAATGTSTINTTGTASTSIGNTTGTLTFVGANNILTGNLSASSYLAGDTLIATDDSGAGTITSTTFTNGAVPYVDGTGAFSVSSVTGAGTATNAGFIKIYVGLTAYYVPYFAATS